jgi:cytidine deaminase
VLSSSGRRFVGSYIENAAFNPSLSPLQVALMRMAMAGEQFSSIVRVVLAEVANAPISQRSMTEAALAGIAPKATLRVITVSL